jgi:hypothetical protein
VHEVARQIARPFDAKRPILETEGPCLLFVPHLGVTLHPRNAETLMTMDSRRFRRESIELVVQAHRRGRARLSGANCLLATDRDGDQNSGSDESERAGCNDHAHGFCTGCRQRVRPCTRICNVK